MPRARKYDKIDAATLAEATLEDASATTMKKRKKRSRNDSKRRRASRLYYGTTPTARSMSKKKDISYSSYAKTLESKGALFALPIEEDVELDDASNVKKQKTCVVRFKKDAKITLQRFLITCLRRINNVCKSVCNLEGLSKIQEKTVYTQIRLSYPPSQQPLVIAVCQKALKAYIDSKPPLAVEATT